MSTQATSQVPSLKGGPKLSCAGGTVQGTSCVCPQGQEPIHVGAHAWRCREKKGPQLTGPPTLSCGGGTVQGTSCICPSGQEGVQVGKHAWRCVKKDQQLAGPPTISCAGGTAKGTTCLCQRGQEAVKVGDNAWRCQPQGPLAALAAACKARHACVRSDRSRCKWPTTPGVVERRRVRGSSRQRSDAREAALWEPDASVQLANTQSRVFASPIARPPQLMANVTS